MKARKKSAGRRKVIIAFLLLFAPAFLLVFIATRGCEHKFKVLDDYGEGNAYAFEDASGKKYTHNDFKNHVVLIANLQETCPDSCGISFWSFERLLYQKIRENRKNLSHVKLITFATDMQGNPIEDLSNIQQMLEDRVVEYNPDIWILAKGNAKEVFDFSHNDINLLEQKGEDYTGGMAFQELMLLIDKDNHLRMVLNGHSEGMVRRMREHVALLQKEYDKKNARKNEN